MLHPCSLPTTNAGTTLIRFIANFPLFLQPPTQQTTPIVQYQSLGRCTELYIAIVRRVVGDKMDLRWAWRCHVARRGLCLSDLASNPVPQSTFSYAVKTMSRSRTNEDYIRAPTFRESRTRGLTGASYSAFRVILFSAWGEVRGHNEYDPTSAATTVGQYLRRVIGKLTIIIIGYSASGYVYVYESSTG